MSIPFPLIQPLKISIVNQGYFTLAKLNLFHFFSLGLSQKAELHDGQTRTSVFRGTQECPHLWQMSLAILISITISITMFTAIVNKPLGAFTNGTTS